MILGAAQRRYREMGLQCLDTGTGDLRSAAEWITIDWSMDLLTPDPDNRTESVARAR